MSNPKKHKLFISYSHQDEELIKEFIKHLAPLKNNEMIEDWYDRKILPGKDYQKQIDNNLDDADIICLFISADFLNSKSCNLEKKRAIKLSEKLGTLVIPIILSPCGWRDDKDISPLLAIPTDGKPVTDYRSRDKAWNEIYEQIKKLIIIENEIHQIEYSSVHLDFLQNTEILSKAHPNKEEVLLEDIFIYPELLKYDEIGDLNRKINAVNLKTEVIEFSNILIAGEIQSGKTALCKQLILDLREKNYLPIYLSLKKKSLKGRIIDRIKEQYEKQYEGIEFDLIPKSKIVLFIDDFHKAKDKDKLIDELKIFSKKVLVVDDIFRLNFRDEKTFSDFTQYKIVEFSPLLRYQLIRKWKSLDDVDDTVVESENELYKKIDEASEVVNSTLGKIIGGGIMPSYPFFILSILSNYESFQKPIDQEITSQGYCYQMLITVLLRKQNVKFDDIGTYINFLSVLASHVYQNQKNEISPNEFDDFLLKYEETFNLPIKKEFFLKSLIGTQIVSKDDFGNYHFSFTYLYYFFIGKYLAEHRTQNEEIIAHIINNLHKNENAYIAIFISHHLNSAEFLDELLLNSMCLFEKNTEATLTKNELSFFDDNIEQIINETLPPSNISPEQIREKRLQHQESVEEQRKNSELQDEETYTELATELRRSIKTVEVMGRILKNHAGTLPRDTLEKVFEEAIKVHLRLLTSFFQLIKEDKLQSELVDFLSIRLEKILDRMEKKPDREKIKKIAKVIFWNHNFFIVLGFINKIIQSLGSNKILSIVEKVCDEIGTPASFLVKHGIYMWYDKNLQVDNIISGISDNDFSEISKKIMKYLVVNYASMHVIGFKEKQKIEDKFKIPRGKLLIENIKESKTKK